MTGGNGAGGDVRGADGASGGAGKVQIVVDDAACVAPEVAERLGITVVDLGLEVQDGESTTSAIGPLPLCAAYARALERGSDAGVVALHLGKALSATHSNAVSAAAVLDNVRVVDTSLVGAGLGAAAVSAAEVAAEGGDLEACVAAAEAVIARNYLWLYVPKLDALRRGGRISTGQAMLSTALSIKPIIGLQDGALGLVAKTRTEGKALDKLVDLASAAAGGRPAEVFLHHADAEDRVAELEAMLSLELADGSTFRTLDIPPSLRAHTGDGAVAVALVSAAADVFGAGPTAAPGTTPATGAARPGAAAPGGDPASDSGFAAGRSGDDGAIGASGASAGDDAASSAGSTDTDSSQESRDVDEASSKVSPDAATPVSGGRVTGTPAGTLPPTTVIGRESSPIFTTVVAKLPNWTENRRMARETADKLAKAFTELARRDNSDPEGAAFGDDALKAAARNVGKREAGKRESAKGAGKRESAKQAAKREAEEKEAAKQDAARRAVERAKANDKNGGAGDAPSDADGRDKSDSKTDEE